MLLLKGKRRLKINLYDSHEQYKDGRELAKTGPLIFKTSVEKVFCIRFDIIQFQNLFAIAQDFHQYSMYYFRLTKENIFYRTINIFVES